MNDHLGIGVGGKTVAALFELVTQFGEVVNLAVIHNPNRLIFVENRLVPTRQVDDAEPAHPQSDAALHEDALVVRATMHDGLTHPMNHGLIDCAVGMSLNDSGYAAHGLSFHTHFGCTFKADSALRVIAGSRARFLMFWTA